MTTTKTLRKGVEENRRGASYGAYGFPLRLSSTFFVYVVLCVGCSDGVKPTATITAADTADQVLYNMTHYVTNQGVLRARVLADTGYFYTNSQVSELRNVHVTFYDVTGRETSTLTSREGTFHYSGDMEGRGNVIVVRSSDGGTLRTEKIRYSQAQNQVSSDLAFTFDAPKQHLKGVGFTSDPDFKDLQAKRVTGTGGQFVLPNQ
jgi:LPS export ABC transporter protein LptC